MTTHRPRHTRTSEPTLLGRGGVLVVAKEQGYVGGATDLPCMQFCWDAFGGSLKVRFRSAGYLVLESKSREPHQVDREAGSQNGKTKTAQGMRRYKERAGWVMGRESQRWSTPEREGKALRTKSSESARGGKGRKRRGYSSWFCDTTPVCPPRVGCTVSPPTRWRRCQSEPDGVDHSAAGFKS